MHPCLQVLDAHKAKQQRLKAVENSSDGDEEDAGGKKQTWSGAAASSGKKRAGEGGIEAQVSLTAPLLHYTAAALAAAALLR